MITLLLPRGFDISRAAKKLCEEAGTSANIKKTANRQSVQQAIASAQAKLKLFKQTPPNGLALFVGNATGKSRPRLVSMAFEPPQPVSRFRYLCDKRFHVEDLRLLLSDQPSYGFIVICGDSCVFASLAGTTRRVLQKLSVELPNRHGRGGQSAPRFQRLRLEKRAAYVRKVAELASFHFLADGAASASVAGLVIAGVAELKDELASSLHPVLKAKLCKTVAVAAAGEAGLSQAIELSSDALSGVRLVAEQRLLGKFFEELAQGSSLVCFGRAETLAALEAGARIGAPPLRRHAALLCAALLLYLEPPSAHGCMCTLLGRHFLAHVEEGSPQLAWRLRATRSCLKRELPETLEHLGSLGVGLDDFVCDWLSSLFLSTLALDTAARVWDCYLRDGEALLWHVAVELLRLLEPRLLQALSRDEALSLLHHASELGGAGERQLFAALAASEGTAHEMLRLDFSQRLPMPTLASGGVVFDLWTNSYEAELGAGAAAAPRAYERAASGLRMADGTRARRLLSEESSAPEVPPLAALSSDASASSSAGAHVSPSKRLLRPLETWIRGVWEGG
mmetsp:Transcript_36963/g.121923  ORF Transcript_36963/g.121923 Transcript_36963/m.121923 type:complete len:566 (-) Transcript_36963:224-1921(-)